jgi:hypothetical protein
MEVIFYADLIVFFIVYGICMIIGLDLKKWQSWLVGFYGFISGWSLGFLLKAGSSSWILGLLFAIVIMSSSIVTHQYRNYRNWREWLTKYGNDKRYSFWLVSYKSNTIISACDYNTAQTMAVDDCRDTILPVGKARTSGTIPYEEALDISEIMLA